MDLREYLFRNKIQIKKIADDLNYSRTHMSGIVHRKLNPSRKLAKLIEAYTKGEVTVRGMFRKRNRTDIILAYPLEKNLTAVDDRDNDDLTQGGSEKVLIEGGLGTEISFGEEESNALQDMQDEPTQY